MLWLRTERLTVQGGLSCRAWRGTAAGNRQDHQAGWQALQQLLQKGTAVHPAGHPPCHQLFLVSVCDDNHTPLTTG